VKINDWLAMMPFPYNCGGQRKGRHSGKTDNEVRIKPVEFLPLVQHDFERCQAQTQQTETDPVNPQALAQILALTEQQVASATDFAGRLSAFIAVRISYWHEKQTLYRVISSLNREVQNRRRRLKWQRQAVDYLTSMFAAAAERGEIPKQHFEAAAWALMHIIRGIHERKILYQEHAPGQEVRNLTEFVLRALGCIRTSGGETESR
jgi:hypothetical protein